MLNVFLFSSKGKPNLFCPLSLGFRSLIKVRNVQTVSTSQRFSHHWDVGFSRKSPMVSLDLRWSAVIVE